MQADKLIGSNVLRFGAAEVGEKHQALSGGFFQQYQPLMRAMVGIHGGQAHGSGVGNAAADGVAHPALELIEGVIG